MRFLQARYVVRHDGKSPTKATGKSSKNRKAQDAPKKQASSKKTTSTLNSEFSEAAEASTAQTDATAHATDLTNQPGEVISSKKKAKKTETAEDSQSPKAVRRNIPLVDLVSFCHRRNLDLCEKINLPLNPPSEPFLHPFD
jgi:hypothetical protein